jgi:hemoglobin/transferrin/lactoferrin receptor protein
MNRYWLFIAIGALFFSFHSYGQAFRFQEPFPDSLRSKTVETGVKEPILLGEIEISSFMVNRKMRELPIPLAVAESNSFRKLSAMTLSNVLATEPGVSMGSDGVWATGINIRGLSENRLVTMIDGNRVETASDLTASFSMVDVNDIERVEVVKGAQSSLFGTGAMGGIVSIITKDGHFAGKPYISGNLISGYASANKLLTGHAEVDAGSEKWYLRLSGTSNKADDIRTPEGILPNSQYASDNITAKAGIKPFSGHILRVQYQNNRASNVGIPGGAAFPGPAEATYTHISRHLFSATYEMNNITDKFVLLKLHYYTQYIQRDVSLIPNSVTVTPLPSGTQRVTPELVLPVGNHLTHGAQLQSTWNLTVKNTLIAGADVWSRKLTTERTKFIKSEVLNTAGVVIKTTNIVRGETPIPESTFGSAGIFLQDETHLLNDRITLITGGRIDAVRVDNEKCFDYDYLIVNGVRNDTPPNQRITFPKGSESSVSWSANVGLLYKLQKEKDLTLNLARSFRAPSLEERFKYIDLGNYVRLGDPGLLPESGYSADLGLRIWKPKFNFQIDAFVNRISNLIVETPGEFIYTLSTGTSESNTDTIPALVNANVSKALLYGIDFGLQYNIISEFVVFASGAYVRGKDTEADASLPQIPPLNGRLGMRYTRPGIGSAEFTLVGAARQDKIAAGEKKTGGYSRIDLAVNSVGIGLGPSKLQLFAGIDNITDRSYTNHLATNRGSISVEPGRNMYLRLSLSF